ncbi:MAG: hypothetical protein R3E95_18235 [Thiolinea sp.]
MEIIYFYIIFLSIIFIFDTYYWITENYFPWNYALKRQEFYLMHWGFLEKPLPKMIDINSKGASISLGEKNKYAIETIKSNGNKVGKHIWNSQ